MTDRIKLIREHLKDMVQDAESRVRGNGSILDYGMKVRRETAKEILRFIQAHSRADRSTGVARNVQCTRSRIDSADAGSFSTGSAQDARASAPDVRVVPS